MLPSCSHHESYITYKSDSDYSRPEFTQKKITLDNEMTKHLDHTKYEILHSHVRTKYKTRVNRFQRWKIKIKNIFDIATAIINHVVLFVVLITKKIIQNIFDNTMQMLRTTGATRGSGTVPTIPGHPSSHLFFMGFMLLDL
jgi:hypothetical protein